MKAIAMVAHPDDCIIFAYSFIQAHPELDWTICYLTYTKDNPRAQEISKFWNTRNIPTKFLGFRDDWNYVKEGNLGFDQDEAEQAIANTIADYDLVLTHGFKGEYGHIHHILVCNSVARHHTCMITFANPTTGNVHYDLLPNSYSLDELPLHRDVIQGFTASNDYCISERVKKQLANSKE